MTSGYSGQPDRPGTTGRNGAPGSYLQKLYEDLNTKITEYRLRLIESMERDMPYRSVKLSPAEQVIKFQRMDGNSWAQLVTRLYERYRGLPDATQKVNADLTRYIRRMMTLEQSVQPNIDPVYQQAFDPRMTGGSLDAP